MKFCVLLLLPAFIFLVFPAFPDLYVNGQDISGTNPIRFLELEWDNTPGQNKGISIIYGEKENLLNVRGFLTDQRGRPLTFKNVHAVLNHIRKEGWRDVRSFIHCQSGISVSHFIFKKK